MPVKSEIKEAPKPEKELTFPRLMWDGRSTVILFTAPGQGTVVAGYQTDIGFRSVGWSRADFTDFHGSVTLSNEDAGA